MSRGYPSGEEVQRALRRCWQPVARVADLRDGPRRVVMGGEALAVFLSASGEPAVVADRCPHRGASLSMGRVRGEGIECPYHGWQWNGSDGRCLAIPSLPSQSQVPRGARVRSYPAREQWGLVWSVLEQPLEPDPPQLDWFDPDAWTWGHGSPFELPVSFGVMVENFRDVAHFAFVHRETMGDVPAVVERLRPRREGTAVTLERAMSAGAGADPVWGSLRRVRYELIAPNLVSVQMFTGEGERGLIHAARATSATESAHFWIEGFGAGFSGCSLEEAIAAEERIYAEDVEIIVAIEPPELVLGLTVDLNTQADRYTLAYREACAEFVRRALADSGP